MENTDSSYRYISEKEIEKTNYANNSSGGEVYLSRERQEEIKWLMFSALEDPRAKYKPITIDEMTEKWIDVKDKTINSN
jgi:hypothetical protein